LWRDSRPAHGLLSTEEVHRLLGGPCSIADLLAFPGAEDLELPLIRQPEPAREIDLT
jgi:hypothetical protein